MVIDFCCFSALPITAPCSLAPVSFSRPSERALLPHLEKDVRHGLRWSEFMMFPLHSRGPAVQLSSPADASPAGASVPGLKPTQMQDGEGITAAGASGALNGKPVSMARTGPHEKGRRRKVRHHSELKPLGGGFDVTASAHHVLVVSSFHQNSEFPTPCSSLSPASTARVQQPGVRQPQAPPTSLFCFLSTG